MTRRSTPEFLVPPGKFDPDEAAARPEGGPSSDSALPEALAQHQTRLLSIAGVEGVAIGRSPAGDDQLTVYVRDSSVRSRLPRQLGGLPVQVVVTGAIDAQ